MYYLGLEARQRDNTYHELNDALDDAAYCARRLSVPIRVFEMLANRKSRLIQTVQPNECKRPLHKKTFIED